MQPTSRSIAARVAMLGAVAVALTTACGPLYRRSTGKNIDPPGQDLELAGRALSPTQARRVADVGFTIVGDHAWQSFHVGYVALFHANQPVYITADSLLYAWHASYDDILAQLERDHLIPELGALLTDLRANLARSDADPQTRADLDVYLTVAARLLQGGAIAPAAGGDPAAIAIIVEHGEQAAGRELELFGAPVSFDFSMLEPRGHYADDPVLQRYFRAMMWLGRAELQLARRDDRAQPWQVDRRALRGALLLASLFTPSDRARWQTIDQTLATLVGPSDSMSLPGLAAGRAALPGDLEGKTDAEIAAAFAAPSAQRIRSGLVMAGAQSISFLLLGQRFVFDASVLSDLTYDTLVTTPPRLMPTPLDVGAAVFHNPAATRLLAPELARYGAPYQAALDAAARRTDAPDDALWNGSVYHLWLGALRALSPDPHADAGLPAPLTSEAWQRRLLATQLASWAELRHDNLLYAKQSFTVELGCEYPTGYVDPYPAFYAQLEAVARKGRSAIEALGGNGPGDRRALAYFDGMATTMAHLRAIALRERANQPLTDDDLDFFNHMVSLDGRDAVCTVAVDPAGWYADLFFDRSKALDHAPVIADVHTQPTDEAGDPVGRVLHVGTGAPHLLVVTIGHDGGAHPTTYRGLVSTYAETITEHFQRLTDQEWRGRIAETAPAAPAWMRDLITP